MTDLAKGSLESDKSTIAHTIDLLTHYSFDLGNHTVTQLLDQWLQDYPVSWVRLAVIEALYQGRYKAVSVNQILQFWQRRDQPLHRFSYEFERLVCNKFPRNLNPPLQPEVVLAIPSEPTVLPVVPVAHSSSSTAPELPAWTALAAQIHRETTHIEPATILSEEIAASQDVRFELGDQPLRHSEPAIEGTAIVNGTTNPSLASPPSPLKPLAASLSNLQANVDAVIDEAISSLDDSPAAMTMRLPTEDDRLAPPVSTHLTETFPTTSTAVNPPLPEAAPIPPVPDFCVKLKAVVEQSLEDKQEEG